MTQINFKQLIEKAKADLLNSEKQKKRKFSSITADELKELFMIRLNEQMKLRRKKEDFIIDDMNKQLINQLFYYIVGASKLFSGDFEKGILVLGNLGSGKTIIMQAFCQVWDDLFNTKMRTTSAKKYVEFVMNPDKFRSETFNILPTYNKLTLFIDDIGKESKKVNLYGTEFCPIADLFAERYDNGSLTFATGNYTLDSLKEQYGETVTDRMKEMFNIIILKGKSRRK